MKRLILILWICIPFIGFAQSNEILHFNLQQAIKTGLQNRYDIQAYRYNIHLAKNNISKNKKAWIPDIHAEGNVQYNTQLRTTIIPKGVFGSTKAQTIQMGAKNVSSFGLSLNQPVFNPGIHTDIKMAATNLALQKEQLHGSIIDIKNDIATAYLNVLLKKLQFKIAENEETRFAQYEALAKGKYKNGALIKNNYLRAQLDAQNASIKTKEAKQDYRLALAYLKYQMNVPQQAQLILSDSIGNISFGKNPLQAGNAVQHRTEIKQMRWQQQVDKLQIKKMKQNALPTVSLQGYYAEIYQNKNFHYNESQWWAPESYIGLNISIPITENLSNKNKIRKYKLKQQQLAFDLQQEKSTIHYQVQKALTDLQNAKNNLRSAKKNYALSQTIYKNQQQQFAIGVFQYDNLLDTEKSLHHAESNYIQSVYKYMTAKIAYRKAMGEW